MEAARVKPGGIWWVAEQEADGQGWRARAIPQPREGSSFYFVKISLIIIRIFFRRIASS